MNAPKKPNIFEQREAAGGLSGYAHTLLCNEISQAMNEPNHALGEYVAAVAKGDAVLAAQKLLEALATALSQPESPLSLSTLLYFKLPLVNRQIAFAAENFDNDEIFDELPREVKRYAGVKLGYHAAKGEAGRAKGKHWNRQIEAKYTQYKDLNWPATRLADKIQKELLQEAKAESADTPDGLKDKRVPVPTADKIRRHIGKLKKSGGF